MTGPNGRALVLAMGNDLLGDDAVGLHAARMLRCVAPGHVDVVETGEAGFALLEFMHCYDHVLILDAIQTLECQPGSILRYSREDFTALLHPSPHYAGLPDLERLARQSGLHFPTHIAILAMEVEEMRHIGEELSPAVASALQHFVRDALQVLISWNGVS